MIRFQTRDMSRAQPHAARVENHLAWLRRLTEASGGRLNVVGALEWAVSGDRAPEATVPVVRAPEPDTFGEIEEVIATCRRDEVSVLGVWAADRDFSGQLGPWLEARGLRSGGQPCWMALDLHSLPEPRSIEETGRGGRHHDTYPVRRVDDSRAQLLRT